MYIKIESMRFDWYSKPKKTKCSYELTFFRGLLTLLLLVRHELRRLVSELFSHVLFLEVTEMCRLDSLMQ
uniref:Uncharacterized protein n=1 Tax=Arundo donax TaxID=35708 RepID=A0A0A8Z8V9_ARUDO